MVDYDEKILTENNEGRSTTFYWGPRPRAEFLVIYGHPDRQITWYISRSSVKCKAVFVIRREGSIHPSILFSSFCVQGKAIQNLGSMPPGKLMSHVFYYKYYRSWPRIVGLLKSVILDSSPGYCPCIVFGRILYFHCASLHPELFPSLLKYYGTLFRTALDRTTLWTLFSSRHFMKDFALILLLSF